MTTRYTDQMSEPGRLLSVQAYLAGFALAGWLASCSVLVDSNRAQCSTDADCAARGAAFAGSVCKAGMCEGDSTWACNAVLSGEGPAYTLTMHIQAVVGFTPLPGVEVQLCNKLDVRCQSPVASSVADDSGSIVMQLDAGFDGYVQMTGETITPSLYFLTPPAAGDLDLTVRLTTPFVAAQIVNSAGGSTWLPDRGIVLLNAFDCQGNPAANISYAIDSAPTSDTFIFYLLNALPTTSVTATDYTGYGGLVNLPEGVTTISAVLAPSGRIVSKISILVRAGFVSYSSVTPNSL